MNSPQVQATGITLITGGGIAALAATGLPEVQVIAITVVTVAGAALVVVRDLFRRG